MEASQEMQEDGDAHSVSERMELEPTASHSSPANGGMQVEEDSLQAEPTGDVEIDDIHAIDDAAPVGEEMHDTAMADVVEDEERKVEGEAQEHPTGVNAETMAEQDNTEDHTVIQPGKSLAEHGQLPNGSKLAPEPGTATLPSEPSSETFEHAADENDDEGKDPPPEDDSATAASSALNDHVAAQAESDHQALNGVAAYDEVADDDQGNTDDIPEVPVNNVTGDNYNEDASPRFQEQQAASRPVLQQDYLAHVDIHQGYESGDAQRSAPHVSLIYDDYEYSLFRPSSTPSGDGEDVLFPVGGEYLDDNEAKGPQQVNEHELYYAPLETVMQRLHAVFPAFKGDGDNEMILDFGILDMQIAEDNVYASQVSLFDIDRIRIGMCQPELDRLQITLVAGKRFAYKFNELAEHCYRMYAGNDDDDSGTILGADADAQDTQELGDQGEYDDAAEDEAGVQQDVATDYTTGQNLEDLPPSEQLQELQAAEASVERSDLPDGPAEHSAPDSQSTAEVGNAESLQSVQHIEGMPPGEASEAISPSKGDAEQGEQPLADGHEGEESGDDVEDAEDVANSYPAQGDGQGEEEQYEEDGALGQEYEQDDGLGELPQGDDDGGEYDEGSTEVIDPDAPLAEAAEQAEAFDESEVTEDLVLTDEAEGLANSSVAPSEHSGPGEDKKVPKPEDDRLPVERPGYQPDEETALVEESDPSIPAGDSLDESDRPTVTKVTKADVVEEEGEVKAEVESEVQDSRATKRNRESLQSNGDAAEGEEAESDGSESKRTRIEA